MQSRNHADCYILPAYGANLLARVEGTAVHNVASKMLLDPGSKLARVGYGFMQYTNAVMKFHAAHL